MSSVALLEAEIPSPLCAIGKNKVNVFFCVYGGCYGLFFIYGCGGSDGSCYCYGGAIFKQKLGIGWLP